MDQSYKRKTNLGVGVGFVVWTFGNMLSHYAEQGSVQARVGALGFIVGVGIFLWGTTSYAMAKGRSPIWGALGLLNLLGMIVLVCMKDRSNEGQVAKGERKQFAVIGCCVGVLVLFFVSELWSEEQDALGGRFTYSNIVVQELDERIPFYILNQPQLTPTEIAILDSDAFADDLNNRQWDWVEEIDPRAKKPIPDGIPTETMMVEIRQITAEIDIREYLELMVQVMNDHGIDGGKFQFR